MDKELKPEVIKSLSELIKNQEDLELYLEQCNDEGRVYQPDRFFDRFRLHHVPMYNDEYCSDEDNILDHKLTIRTFLTQLKFYTDMFSKYDRDEETMHAAETILSQVRISLYELADITIALNKM